MGSDQLSNSSMLLCMVAYKNVEYQMKNERAKFVKPLYSYILDAKWASYTVVGVRMWPNIKLFQAFMVVIVTCKNEKVPFKNEVARVVTTDPSL